MQSLNIPNCRVRLNYRVELSIQVNFYYNDEVEKETKMEGFGKSKNREKKILSI